MKQYSPSWKISGSLLSFILTYWIIFLNPVINHDGILYLQTADLFLQGDWSGAVNLYPWPFYPLIIAILSKFTSLALESSAHLITALSAAMLTYVFLVLLQEIDREKTVPFFIAVFVIVFFSELNETRNLIVREHGYWSFYLLALLLFLRFYRLPTIFYGLGWNMCMIIATLFRIEGLVFLVLLPVLFLLRKDLRLLTRCRQFLAANCLTMGLVLGGLLLFFTGLLPEWLNSSRLTDPLFFLNRLQDALGGGLAENAAVIEDEILNKYSGDAAIWAALAIPLIIIGLALIKALTPLYAVLLCWQPGRNISRLRNLEGAVFLWAVFLNLLIFVVVTLARYFLFERFVLPLVFLLLLVLCFTLAALYARWKKEGGRQQPWRKKWIYYLLCLLLIVNSGEALFHLPGDSKRYLKTAGIWLRENVDQDARIFTNNIKLRFYSGKLDNEDLPAHEIIAEESLRNWLREEYDYYALWLDHRSSLSGDEVDTLMGGGPLHRFANNRGDQVLIYRR